MLRVSLGAMFLAHSLILKLFVFTLPGTADFFAAIGLPGWFAYLVFAAEAAGGALLVLVGVLMVTGVWTAMMAQLQGVIGSVELPI